MTDSRTVTAKEARSRILKCFKTKRPLFLWGPPGIGKSDLVAGITADLGGKLYDLRMPLLEPTDLRGIPFYNKETGQMDWASPVLLDDVSPFASSSLHFLDSACIFLTASKAFSRFFVRTKGASRASESIISSLRISAAISLVLYRFSFWLVLFSYDRLISVVFG